MRWDACNGDADGLCALHQWRLVHPAPEARLVTGPKRDIELLARVPAGAGDEVTVFDVSLARNRPWLDAMLERGASVRWFDHHDAGDPPRSGRLTATIQLDADVCTSILVDRAIYGAHRAWAVVGAFGDGLGQAARDLATAAGIAGSSIDALRELGEAINYNAYGEGAGDVILAPAEVYATMSAYASPFAMLERERIFKGLAEERRADLARARSQSPARKAPGVEVWCLVDGAWARRVSGTLASARAAEDPGLAVAVLTHSSGALRASVRVPRQHPCSALDFCRRYPTGGGRLLAAGIDRLDVARLEAFMDDFVAAYSRPAEVETPGARSPVDSRTVEP